MSIFRYGWCKYIYEYVFTESKDDESLRQITREFERGGCVTTASEGERETGAVVRGTPDLVSAVHVPLVARGRPADLHASHQRDSGGDQEQDRDRQANEPEERSR